MVATVMGYHICTSMVYIQKGSVKKKKTGVGRKGTDGKWSVSKKKKRGRKEETREKNWRFNDSGAILVFCQVKTATQQFLKTFYMIETTPS